MNVLLSRGAIFRRESKQKLFCLAVLCLLAVSFLLYVTCFSKKIYTITFKDFDNTIIEVQKVKEGELPIFRGKLEGKIDENGNYTFLSWDKPLVRARKDETYTVLYTNAPIEPSKKILSSSSNFDIQTIVYKINKDSKQDDKIEKEEVLYEITFVDDDGKVLKSGQYKYGDLPSCVAPSAKTIDNYKYTFKSWSPLLRAVTENQTYVATYKKTLIEEESSNPQPVSTCATIKYKDANENVQTINIDSGTTISFSAGAHGSYLTIPASITLTDNQFVDITGSSYTPNNIDSGYRFKGFTYSGGVFTASYIEQYTIVVSSNSIPSCSVSSGGTYDINSSVEISAIAGAGCIFQKWQINGADDTSIDKNTPNRTIIVSANVEYKAIFAELPEKGDIIELNDGNNYRVLSINGSEAFVLGMTAASSSQRYWDSNQTIDFSGNEGAKYEGSDLDAYLNTTWYGSLADGSTKQPMHDAIQAVNINQNIYKNESVPSDATTMLYTYKYQINWNDSTYSNADDKGSVSIANRYVYVLNMSDIFDYYEKNIITSNELNKLFFNQEIAIDENIWLRSAYIDTINWVWGVSGSDGTMKGFATFSSRSVRPSFVIDLSATGVTFAIQ